jgi:cell division protease FtsH
MQLPEQDRYSHNREYLLARIAVLMGGRIAEELFMNQMTTGASNDFEHATELAHKMVSSWGMSDELGPRTYGDAHNEVFLGRDMSTRRDLSDSTALKVDIEISRIIDEQYDRARKILEENRDKVEAMAKALMDWETLDAKQINDIMAGQEPRPPQDAADDGSSGGSSADGKKKPRGKVKPRLDKPAGNQI